jgi:phosphoribosylamine--glycine ligase
MNVAGKPKVVEYNARMGDPETEVVIPRIKSDLLELFEYTAEGRLQEAKVEIDPRIATTVMMVSGGYPEAYAKGKTIRGLGHLPAGVTVFHAGTKMNGADVVTNGGRVLALTAFGKTMDEALSQSYQAAELAEFEGKYFRRDIGFELRAFWLH